MRTDIAQQIMQSSNILRNKAKFGADEIQLATDHMITVVRHGGRYPDMVRRAKKVLTETGSMTENQIYQALTA